MDLTSKEPNLNMPNRVFGLTEAEFLIKNALSTTPGHLLTTGRPQNARKHKNTYPKHKIQKHDHLHTRGVPENGRNGLKIVVRGL